MARVTIEDALKEVRKEKGKGIFHLVLIAAKRAHQLQHGATPKIRNARGEKNIPDAVTVLALREIAAGFTDFSNEVIPQKDVWGNKIETPKPTHPESKAIVARDNKEE